MAPQRDTISGRNARRVADATALRLSILWTCLFAAVGIHLPYFTVWLASRGLNDTAIAWAVALPMLIRIVTTPFIAYVADRRGIAATLAFAAICAFASYLFLGFAPTIVIVFVGAVAVGLAQGFMPALADALTLSEIRRLDDVGLRKLEFGRVRVCASLSVLGTMLASGFLVGPKPGQNVIWLLVAISLFPAVATSWNATKSWKTRLTASRGGTLVGDRKRLRLALVCIVAAALIQASHAEVYTFGTLHWRAIGLSPTFIGLAWASGVACESIYFMMSGRVFGGERRAIAFLATGGAAATLRWTAMSFDPAPAWLLMLQGLHALSFAATYTGSILLLASLAGPNHRARMQGWLASTVSLATAGATVAAGRLTTILGERTYLVMAALALGGFGLALIAGLLKRQLPSPPARVDRHANGEAREHGPHDPTLNTSPNGAPR